MSRSKVMILFFILFLLLGTVVSDASIASATSELFDDDTIQPEDNGSTIRGNIAIVQEDLIVYNPAVQTVNGGIDLRNPGTMIEGNVIVNGGEVTGYIENITGETLPEYCIFPEPENPGYDYLNPYMTNNAFGNMIFNCSSDGSLAIVDLDNDEDYSFPDYAGINIGNVVLSNNDYLEFNLQNDLKIQIDSLTVKNGGKIRVSGKGSLIIYLGEFNGDFGGIEVIGDDIKFGIVYLSEVELEIKTSGVKEVNVLLYAPLTPLKVTNSIKIVGSIICKSMILENSAAIIAVQTMYGVYPEPIQIDPSVNQ